MSSIKITNLIVVDQCRSVRYRSHDVMIDTTMSSDFGAGAVVVDAFPVELSWKLLISLSEEQTSTVTWAASVRDPHGVELAATPTLTAPVLFGGEAQISLPSFIARLRGTYTVRLTIEAPESCSRSVPIAVDLRRV